MDTIDQLCGNVLDDATRYHNQCFFDSFAISYRCNIADIKCSGILEFKGHNPIICYKNTLKSSAMEVHLLSTTLVANSFYNQIHIL